jgi:putative peptidoglycan lipid II flippase
VPHGIVTVSLATALIPTLSALAADRSFDEFGQQLASALRIVLAVIGPLAVATAILGPSAIQAVAFGGLRANAHAIGWTVAAFAPTMVLFAIHYMMLRGFYAMENTRTPFLIQVVVALTNIAAALTLTSLASPQNVSVALALAFGLSYLVGATLSALLLPRMTIFGPEMRLFLVRLAIACIGAALVMLAVLTGLQASGVPADTPARALGLVALAGPAGAATYLLLSRVVGLTELASVVSALRRRG